MPDRLPPLRAAEALEAVDRLGSLAAAAEALSLTRSAVSHAIRRLEGDLDFALTEPDGRGVRMTARGRLYAAEARRALAILRRAAAEEAPLSGELRLACPPGFGALWLAERLGGFRALHPEIALQVSASRRLGRMTDGAADVEIGFGEAAEMPPGARLLTRVSLFPVCAPSLLNADPGLRRASDLARLTLLHLVTPVDWERWLQASGAEGADPRGGVVLSDMPMVQAAAEAGQGVALGDSLTAASALAAGRLVRPFALSIPCRWSYFIRVGEGEAAAALAGWIAAALPR